MKKLIIFSIIIAFALNIKSAPEEELIEAYTRLKNIDSQINVFKRGFEKYFYTGQKLKIQDDIESIKKSLPSGRGDEIIKALEEKTKTKK